jgi:UDP-glucose 4-epimerase
MNARVLVTGAGGYLGGRLVQMLAAAPAVTVRAASRGPARSEWGSTSEFFRLDNSLSPRSLADACRDISHVVHLASPNEHEAAADPLAAVEGTIGVTVRVLDAAIAAGVRRVVYLSTAHVYGAPLIGHIAEDHPTRPVHPYAITHRAAEDFTLATRQRGIESAVIRLSNAVGAPITGRVDRWTLIANDAARQLMESGRVTLKSPGLQYRDFIPLADACHAIEHLLMLPTSLLSDGVFNVGAGRSMRVRDLVELVCRRYEKLTGVTPTIDIPTVLGTEQSGALDYRIDKLLMTGFRLTASLEEEIDATLRICGDTMKASRT